MEKATPAANSSSERDQLDFDPETALFPDKTSLSPSGVFG
jgi:hypothetical protein